MSDGLLECILLKLDRVTRPDRAGWRTALCPFHDDHQNPNLRISEQGFKCMACEERGGLRKLAAKLGVEATPTSAPASIVGTYDYTDEQGCVLFQAVRLRSKNFKQRRPNGSGGWIWDLKGVRLVPYRLPEILSAAPERIIFVVEGEKDVDRLRAEGIPATCNPMGAGKWRDEYSEFLRDRSVVIVADNDDVGRKHAEAVARSAHGVAVSVRVLALPGLPEKGDVSDWLDAGGTAAQLLGLVDALPPWGPAEPAAAATDGDFRRTDAGNGELFAQLYGDRVRYDHRRRRWLTWSGHRWTEDCDGEIRRLAKLTARHRYVTASALEDLAARAAVAKFAIDSENRKRLDAVLVQAQTEPPIADAGVSWNSNPWLLALANGVVDLRSGLLRPGQPDDRITMQVPVAFDADATCPRWLRFLDEVFRGQPEAAVNHHPAIVRPSESEDQSAEQHDEFRRTDAGNGELFAQLYGDRARYDHRRRRWLTWTGHRWTEDCDGEIRRLAKLAARHRYVTASALEDLAARAAVAKFAIDSENRKRLDAVLVQAQTEPPIADAGTSWNSDPWLVAVANGVVDLRSGLLRPGRPDDRITMQVPVVFDAGATCPRWLQFLDEVFRGDGELIDFIHRAAGYSITGITSEQCLFLCYGKGSNGKSVLLSILRALAGEYAYNAPFSLFEMHGRSAIPNDLAALVSKRLVSSSETNEGTRLNEARLKALTGCDSVTARFLHGEFFTFEPVAKYWLAVNHKPTVGDDSHGFWRRVRLIPFMRQFDEGKDADQGLTEALLRELPGVFAWAVRGALEWQRRGIAAPSAVRSATETYRVESDPLAQFIDECCLTGEGFTVQAAQAFKAYKSWCADQGMSDRDMLGSKAFGARMSVKFDRRHTNKGNAYDGVGLASDRQDNREVKDGVKGGESDALENDVFSTSDSPVGENSEIAFTTLHPSPDGGQPRCDNCGRVMSVARVSTLCMYCKGAK